jgi:pyruvate dehydrogenase E2 component (dihydrolipoamide acetyltransferase)
VTQMRQIIGRRLLESKQQLPHFYITERVDAGALAALRPQLNAIDGVKITFNDLMVKAVALPLMRPPQVNSPFQGDVIRQYGSADISIAVAIPDGLITPILRNAESLTVSQISAGVKDLAKRAVAGKLKPEEYQGGSFTISNLGMYGIEEFSGIINPPQAAILAVGGIKDEPVVRDGQVVPGTTLRITLSADHRVVDGAVGAAFIKDLR